MVDLSKIREGFKNIMNGMIAAIELANAVVNISRGAVNFFAKEENRELAKEVSLRLKQKGAPTWAKLLDEAESAATVVLEIAEEQSDEGEEGDG